jgi:adenylate cyclase
MKTHCVVLFVDIVGSTALYESLGDGPAHLAVSQTLRHLRDIVEQKSGQVIKTIGDELMCRFESAGDALMAAEAMQNEQSRSASGLKLRVAFNAGDVLTDGHDLFGDAVNLCARLVGVAKPGQILLTAGTSDLLATWMQHVTRPVGNATVKGKSQSIPLREVIWDHGAELTMLESTLTPAGAAPAQLRLVLQHDNREFVVDPNHPRLNFGRDSSNDMVVLAAGVSRLHGRIEQRGNSCVLQDFSANGTVLFPAEGRPVILRRTEHVLSGSGTIQCGPPGSAPIHYKLAA